MKKMEKRGVFKKEEDFQVRKARTIKSIVKTWANKNLKISDSEWDLIKVEQIKQTSINSSVIFIKCKTTEDISRITSKVSNLPKEYSEDPPRLIPFVPIQFKDRYQAINDIGKKMRENSKEPIKTSTRAGRFDYLLRYQSKNQNTKWSQIPPIVIKQKLPEFNVGILKKNNEVEKSEEESIEEEDQLIFKNMELENPNKRNISESENQDQNKIQKLQNPLLTSTQNTFKIRTIISNKFDALKDVEASDFSIDTIHD